MKNDNDFLAQYKNIEDLIKVYKCSNAKDVSDFIVNKKVNTKTIINNSYPIF